MKDIAGNSRTWRKLTGFLVGVAIVVLYAYAIQVTQINLEEPFEPNRQKNLISLVRDLARPDLFKFEGVTRSNNVSLRMPCPEEIKGSQVTFEGRTMLLRPNCVSTTQDLLNLIGDGFPANVRGAVIWHPPGELATARRVAEFRADGDGNFIAQFTMPDVRPSEDVQRLEVVEILDRHIAGLSEASRITIEKIIETVLMALMASTIGTILAIPVSFLAARNLMTDLGMPLASLMSALVIAPLGAGIGLKIGQQLTNLSALAVANIWVGSILLLAAAAAIWTLLGRMAKPAEAVNVSSAVAIGRSLATILLAIFTLALLAQLGLLSGAWLKEALGVFGFIGNFIFVVADLTNVFLPAVLGAVVLFAAASAGSRFGQNIILRQSVGRARAFTVISTFFGSTILCFLVTYSVNWICLLGVCHQLPQEMPRLLLTLLLPSVFIGLVAAALAWRTSPKQPYPVGTVTYTLIRTVLNILRSIEPVIMGIVFVVWVGLGPFAGILALTLHSVADLGKLFSEQVENIAEGPLEAVTATGANRFQTIVFAVVPQVVPHYIAFTFYRWDINVRMSTIIGFVGGGGIGFVLQRHANLTQYRQAAVMVIAIAVVVTLLDNISSRIRSRII